EEVGVRMNFLGDRLSVEASAFDITNTNVVQGDPFGNVGVFPPDPRNDWKFVDGISNRGFEVDVKVNLSGATQVLFSYANYDLKNAGNPAQVAAGIKEYPVNNSPQHQASLWLKWSPQHEALRGWRLTGGARYMGERSAGGIGALPSLYLPAYTIVDAGVGYAREKWAVDLLVRNVFDEYAIRTASTNNRIYPEQPLHAMLAASVSF
ncbi:MAG TPA: TonB-dependent receptor, partial [Opitutus sp.]|nr:TonB-dependent receptor [Opitutus sp.]